MENKNPQHKVNIQNSTSEFLIFTEQEGVKGIEARYEDETIWLTQKLMAELFDVDTNTIGEHLQNIFKSYELDQNSVTRKFRVTARDGKNYKTQFYNLDAIISVGYRVNSKRATQFRQWATKVLHQFAINSKQPRMGLTSWKNAPEGKILKTDVSVAKNYLYPDELDSLGRIVNTYLELAESRAKREIPMTMKDWASHLDKLLALDAREILEDTGKISAQIAKEHAQSEFEQYRIIQDHFFESDFDREVKAIENEKNNKNYKS